MGRSSVVEFFDPCLVSALFTGPSLLEMKFFQKLFPLVPTSYFIPLITKFCLPDYFMHSRGRDARIIRGLRRWEEF